jgi:hypothetical protein
VRILIYAMNYIYSHKFHKFQYRAGGGDRHLLSHGIHSDPLDYYYYPTRRSHALHVATGPDNFVHASDVAEGQCRVVEARFAQAATGFIFAMSIYSCKSQVLIKSLLEDI